MDRQKIMGLMGLPVAAALTLGPFALLPFMGAAPKAELRGLMGVEESASGSWVPTGAVTEKAEQFSGGVVSADLRFVDPPPAAHPDAQWINGDFLYYAGACSVAAQQLLRINPDARMAAVTCATPDGKVPSVLCTRPADGAKAPARCRVLEVQVEG